MLKVRELSFRYPDSQQNTLDLIDLDIHKGEWIVIKGASGCGKTTLAMALAGFLFHTTNGDYQGKIEIKGKAIEDSPLSEIAKHVYLVQQNPENQFCTLTVQDEIAFGLENRSLPPAQIKKRICQSLEIVNGENLLNASMLELSGGEKQKIAIATAVALKPDIIILDEPTSNLDPISSQEVFQALNQMKELDDITVIIIEHKFKQAMKFATRVFCMADGKVIEEEQTSEKKKTAPKRVARSINPAKVNWEPIVYVKNINVVRQEKTITAVDELMVYPGEFIAMMGPNGSGKTSFLLGLLGLLESVYEAGQLFGRDIHAMKTFDIARNTGYVFQNPDHQIFCDSVEDEVFLAPKNFDKNIDVIKPDVFKMINTFILKDKLAEHPYHLSYGQKKRLNLASVLAYCPKLLLLDEIFIGQDDENIKLSLKILNEYIERNQAAVILVNHYINPLIDIADRLIFMDKGRMLFDVPMNKYAVELIKYKKQEFLPDYC